MCVWETKVKDRTRWMWSSYGSLASRSFPVQGRTNVEMLSAEKDPPGFSSLNLSFADEGEGQGACPSSSPLQGVSGLAKAPNAGEP